MSISKSSIQQKYRSSNSKKKDLKYLSKQLQQCLLFMNDKINKQMTTYNLFIFCGHIQDNFTITETFKQAFLSLNLSQKIQYYSQYVNHIWKYTQKKKNYLTAQTKTDQTISSFKLQKSFHDITMTVKIKKNQDSFQNLQIIISNNYIIKSIQNPYLDINLHNYLIRKSKKKQLHYILQGIKHSNQQLIRIQFLSNKDQEKYLPLLNQCLTNACFQNIKYQIDQLIIKKMLSPVNIEHSSIHINNNDMNDKKFIPSKTIFQKCQNSQLSDLHQKRLNKSSILHKTKKRYTQDLNSYTSIYQPNNTTQNFLNTDQSKQSTFLQQNPSNRNLFKIILPQYQLQSLPSLTSYSIIYQSSLTQFTIYQDNIDYTKFKLNFISSLPIHIICKAICHLSLYKFWNPVIEQGQIKLKIVSENCCIMYMKTKSLSQWYRHRDYLFITHLFKNNSIYYIIQKSIQNSSLIPFQSITRGDIKHCVWKIQQENHNSPNPNPKCRILLDLQIDHGGSLPKNYQKQISLKYLKGFQQLEVYFKDQKNQKKLTNILNIDWCISDNTLIQIEQQHKKQHQQHLNSNTNNPCDNNNTDQFFTIMDQSQNQCLQSQQLPSSNISPLKTITFSRINQKQQIIDIKSQQQQQLLKNKRQIQSLKTIIKNKNQQQQQQQKNNKYQIKPLKPLLTNKNEQIIDKQQQQQIIELNEEGFAILPKQYLKKKHITQPFDAQRSVISLPYNNLVQKNDWILQKKGGLKLISRQKIAAQNSVFKFIIKNLKNTLLSGKGVNGICLPVDIFNIDSNLRRCSQAMTLGPYFLQPIAKSTNTLQRFKQVLAFGLSNTIMYFDVEKPFNPILGQTYQGYIRGCPIYGQQISHHPPISSIYFIGRGYKITANLQAKVFIHINSGEGINQGTYHVIFDDGQQIQFQTPPAQLSGIAMGDRRFNIKGKGYYLDITNKYYCEMIFDNINTLWSLKNKQYIDKITGQIYKVNQQFIQKYLHASLLKKPTPLSIDIIQKLGVLSGRWPLYLKIDNKMYYNIKQDLPDKIIDQIYPLNSNSNYRQDIIYRKKNNLKRSQKQKQKLEIIQRNDKKNRDKINFQHTYLN